MDSYKTTSCTSFRRIFGQMTSLVELVRVMV